jgi:hypothetical protein
LCSYEGGRGASTQQQYELFSILLKSPQSLFTEVGKANLKSNGDEALSDESPQETSGDEALNVNFP